MPPPRGRLLQQLRNYLSENQELRHDRARINIISPELCDHALRRLQPSLPWNRPLDIIDIHPGVCLWSSMVHKALKPRRHVLVEPDRDAYKSYIDPLLEEQDSNYLHVPELSDLFTGAGAEYLPDQRPVTSKIISKGRTNDSLLILANLASLASNQKKLDGSASARNIHSYLRGMVNQKNTFHHYGLVRMLAWVADEEKHVFLPRTINYRKRFSVRLDLAAHVTEVAGGVPDEIPSYQPPRQHDLAVESNELVSLRTKELGIWNPESRRPPLCRPPWHEIGLVPDATEQLRKLPQKLPWQKEMLDLEDALAKGKLQVNEQPAEEEKRRRKHWSAGYRSLGILRTKFLTTRKARTVARDWATRQNELDVAEIDLLKEGQSLPTLAASKEALRQKGAALHAEMASGRKDLALHAMKYIDDRRGFHQQPPLLQWDRRTAEPLVVNKDEFYPVTKKMALLDLRPQPETLDRLDNLDKRTCFDYLCSLLFRHPTQPIRPDLITAVRGGLDEFLERVPDLQDPLKGGNHNIDDLRVRTLPLDLLIQLALALETWPFRMQTHDMIMNIGRKKPSVIVEDD